MAKIMDKMQSAWDRAQAERIRQEALLKDAGVRAQNEADIRDEKAWEAAIKLAQLMERKPPWATIDTADTKELAAVRTDRVVRVTSTPDWAWTENRYGITEATYDNVGNRYFDQLGRQIYQHRDPDGRMYWKPVNEEEETWPTEQPEKIVATVHKAGHFPIEWMIEASKRAEESDALVHIEVDKTGVVVVAEQGGEDYAQLPLPWVMMEKAEVNPLIPAIEHVERQLRVLAKAKKGAKQ